ncbi:MAG: efflux transporter periplasmic adaptor subunit [Flavobacterium sp. BFFFF1]|uniref:efflux RND transporter periplasmic adaptor subunit n=1 Tax=unclassified Flavobacterium TaxID=196869 RepID=UPI000BD9FDBB|nr:MULTISPECIES: efflux RND transporter periplasmic adaptor subunit [unclassified Flavobacterium]OYU80279.1 MAG: efflux transporter periplasmic adaptor subunit [Flavobacterium sp. BFFFF1]
MKKIILISALSLALFSCGKSDDSVDGIIKSGKIEAMKSKRAALQADLTKIDQALALKEGKKEEVLVAVTTVKDTVFTHYLEIQGNVDTQQNVLLQPEMPGTLVTLNAKAGQRVSKGQVLGKIDDGGLSQQVAQLENQYELAKTTYERQKRLWDQKIGSEIQFLQAQTQMVSAQKMVNQTKAQLSKTLIKAPFAGTIDGVFVERGEVVSPSAKGLMRVVNLGNLYISTSVPESYIGKLRVGTIVDVEIGALGKTYVGKVRQIANSINPENRSFDIEVSIPNPDNLLRPNQVAKLKIIDYSNKTALVVPTNVIQKDGENNQYVFVASDIKGKTAVAKKVVVKTGQSANNMTEILGGLNPDDVIVTEGANTISEGMKLNF